MPRKYFGSAAVLAALSLVVAAPQKSFSGAFEAVGMGARALSMGQAFVAVQDDYQSVYYNPSGLGKLRQRTLHSEYRTLYGLGLLRYITAGYLHPGIGKGTVGLAWSRLDTIGDASFLDYAENTLIFSYGTNIFNPLSIGVNGKYYRVNSTLGASGMGVDVGLAYDWKGFTLGAAVQDINRTVISWDSGAKDRIPIRVRTGLSRRFFRETLGAVQVQWEDQKHRSHHLGIEQGIYKRAFFLRFGLVERDDDWRFAWGLGLRIKFLSIDYGWEKQRLLGDTQVFSTTFKF